MLQDKTKMLKNLSLDEMNVRKNALFFLSRAPAHHSFAFNSRFWYKQKHKFCLPKSLCVKRHISF